MLCECGCGEATNVPTRNDIQSGRVKGRPNRFVGGHQNRGRTKIQDCVENFWAGVNKNGPLPSHCPELGPCWLWAGRTTPDGYGLTWFEGEYVYTHRLTYFLRYGVWPEHRSCHHCDTPACVNPEHVFDGTGKDNSEDMVEKGRSNHGEGRWNAKFTEAQVVEIRNRYATGKTSYLKLAKEYKVVLATMAQLLRGETWKHLLKENQ